MSAFVPARKILIVDPSVRVKETSLLRSGKDVTTSKSPFWGELALNSTLKKNQQKKDCHLQKSLPNLKQQISQLFHPNIPKLPWFRCLVAEIPRHLVTAPPPGAAGFRGVGRAKKTLGDAAGRRLIFKSTILTQLNLKKHL